MSTKQNYTIRLDGGGLQLEREIGEATAHRIITLVMAGEAPSSPLMNMTAAAPAAPIPATLTPNLAGASPKNFMVSKSPATEIERVACIGYYLKHYKGIHSFKRKDLIDVNAEAMQPRISNPSYALGNAAKAKLIVSAGGGGKSLTIIGEQLTEALPNRDAVKQVLEANKHLRKRKERPAKKTKKAGTK